MQHTNDISLAMFNIKKFLEEKPRFKINLSVCVYSPDRNSPQTSLDFKVNLISLSLSHSSLNARKTQKNLIKRYTLFLFSYIFRLKLFYYKVSWCLEHFWSLIRAMRQDFVKMVKINYFFILFLKIFLTRQL